ncbi:hypothetical protein RUM44_012710 [Polyplax serrata]|uniref:DUF4757 domain-containing protein n=1 Tax=Polyplax serrata TaxID=468196 RepID=A0ABR1BC21_POLSC
MPGTERRLSTSSDDANAPPQRQLSQDGTEIIPTRMSKVTTPKPASNPLQFIKTGPCDLYKAAQEQMKKVEEIKKVEKVKDDSEDWQSNLDNWKCSRRKRQEHIIERVVEVKKLELEEHDRNRRRSKTFNEMMEERNSKGGLRKMSILSFSEEDSNDLSDLGISSTKEKSSGDFTTEQNGSNNYHTNSTDGNGLNNSNGHSAYDDGSSTPATISSPEPEEYTYERAIQGYMDFAEGKVKTPVKGPAEKTTNGNVNFRICSMKKEPGGKIGEKLSELEQIRLRSKSTNDISGTNEAKQLPKVDVLKRRSLFENADATDTVNVKSSDRVSKDLSNSKSIKERLSNLEKSSDATTKVNRHVGDVAPHIKDTISNLEKQKAESNTSGKKLSNGDVSPQISIKERLNYLEKQSEEEGVGKCRSPTETIPPVSLKERMSNFDGMSEKATSAQKVAAPERDVDFKEKLESFKLTEKSPKGDDVVNSITLTSSNNCSDSKILNINRLDGEKEQKRETDLQVAQTPEYSSENPMEQESQTKGQDVETVSLPQEEKLQRKKSVVVVVVDNNKSQNEWENATKPKETEHETDYYKMVAATLHERESDTNTQMVKGVLTKEIESSSSLTDGPTNGPNLSDLSKTIVTKISIPEPSVPCPRVNISVSMYSGARETTPPEGSEEAEALDEFPEDVPDNRDRITKSQMNQPRARVRKLTPMLNTSSLPMSSLKTVCELQIIEEKENQEEIVDEKEESEEKRIVVHATPGMFDRMNSYGRRGDSSVQATDVLADVNEDNDELHEESTLYTDENIEEVLGKDEDEVETMVDDEPQFIAIPEEEKKIQKELEIFTPKLEATELLMPLKPEISEKSLPLFSNYENVFITNQVPQMCMTPDSDIYTPLTFPFGSRSSVEPPKEKPPPPPLDLSDEESAKPELPPKPSLRRLDSTKRIKKEIRKKRSDFLGIEGSNDDSYLEPGMW